MILEEESERKTLLISLADSSVPSPSTPLSLRRTRREDLLFHPSSKPDSLLLPLLPSSLLCRFRMPIKLTSCLVNDRRGKSNSGLIRCKVARRTSFRYRKRKDLCLGREFRRDRSIVGCSFYQRDTN